MLTVLALAMIILFIVLLSMKKLSVFTSLTLVPFVFGIIAILVTDSSISDLFTWIQEGVFFSVDPETAKAIRDSRAPEQEDSCSMCGKFCAVRSMNKALNGEYIDIL